MRSILLRLLLSLCFAGAGLTAVIVAPATVAAQTEPCADPAGCGDEGGGGVEAPCSSFDSTLCGCKVGTCFINEKGNYECPRTCTYKSGVEV